MHLTLSELDATPPGWDEELTLALAGLAAAAEVAAKRRKGSQPSPQAPEYGKPVYGRPGLRFDPERGFR